MAFKLNNYDVIYYSDQAEANCRTGYEINFHKRNRFRVRFFLYGIKRPRRRKSKRKQWLNSHRSRRQAVCNRAEDTSQVLFSSSRVLVSSIASRRTQQESRGGGGSLTNHTQCSRSLLTSSSFTVLPRYKEIGEFKCSFFQTRTNTGKNCLQHWEKL